MNRPTSLVLLCFALIAGGGASSFAQVRAFAGDEVRVRISAASHDRRHALIEAKLEVPAAISREDAERIRAREIQPRLTAGGTGDGRLPDAEVVSGPDGAPSAVVLRFVEPALSAGSSNSYLLRLDKPREAPRFVLETDGREGRLTLDGKTIWSAVGSFDPKSHETTFKSFDHVHDFGAGHMLTKGPGGEFSHHRGLFIGWSKTGHDGRVDDFWHGQRGGGSFVHYLADAPEALHLGTNIARTRRASAWIDPSGAVVIDDTREVTTWRVDADRRIFDYRISLRAARDTVDLDGDPQHAGFQFRAANEVNESKVAYLRPESAVDLGNDVWENCAWVAGRFTIRGESYVVVHLDHPDNPTPVYSTRDYGRFGAFFRGRLEPGEPLELRYRIVLLSPRAAESFGTADALSLQHDFVRPAGVTVDLPSPNGVR